MPSVPYPYDDPYVWNRVVLGPHALPGRAVFPDGVELARDFDDKKAKGKSGKTSKDEGYDPKPISFELHIRTREEHEAWERIYPRISPRREGATNEPYEILNAYTFEAGVETVTIRSIKPGKWSTDGKRIIKFVVKEWSPTPKKVKAGTGTPKPATPNVGSSGYFDPIPVSNGLTDPSSPVNVQSMVGELLGMNKVT